MAGTVARFLTAALSVEKSTYLITGDKRMQQRPMQILLDALKKIGVSIKYLEKNGFFKTGFTTFHNVSLDTIWIGTRTGIVYFNPITKSFKDYELKRPNGELCQVKKIVQDKLKEELKSCTFAMAKKECIFSVFKSGFPVKIA